MNLELHRGSLYDATLIIPRVAYIRKFNGFAFSFCWLKWGVTIIGVTK